MVPLSERPVANLRGDFRIEVDKVDRAQWRTVLSIFADASLYQTIEYGERHPGGRDLSHLVVRGNDRIIAAAQLRIRRLPLIGRGIAYLYWGPLWRPRGAPPNPENLALVLEALHAEYVIRRRYLLRLVPNIYTATGTDLQAIFAAAGFRRNNFLKPYRTILLDLHEPLDVIRKNLRRNWRNHLSKAERGSLVVDSGGDREHYEVFRDIYAQMYARKRFRDSPDIANYACIQEALPVEHRMRVFTCRQQGEPVASAVCSVVGDTAVYLFGATSRKGMQSQGSYLIQWHIIQWLKEIGCRCYDLGGVDPENNPNVFHFKEGMGGELACALGHFEACEDGMSRLVVSVGELPHRFKHALG